MKARIATLVLVGMVACSLAAVAQTNPPAADTAVTPAADTATVTATDTNTNAAAETATAPATESASAATQTATGEAVGATPDSTNATPDTNAVIPLIVMDDVPLTDAIKNLARQAGLNYMLDPKLTYGQPGPNGKITPQPSVSIRWENVTAGQALSALLNNYNLQLVQDIKTGISRVTVKDPAAPDPLVTSIIQLKWANPSNVLSAIRAVLVEDKRSKVVPDIRTSQLVVLATEKQQAEVDKLIKRLDTPTKQVLIEARLLETSMNPSTVKGINWAGTLKNQNLTMGNNLQANNPGDSLNNTLSQSFPKLLFDTAKGFNPATAFLDADGLSAVLSFINQNSEAKVLSEPRTVTLDNEPAHISVTRASPIINITPSTTTTAGGSQVTYTNLGVILDVTPRISANNYVNLKVVPEVSRIFDTVTKQVAIGEYQADEYDIRKITTTVMIPSGNTLVLGGLVQDDERFSSTKVPILGDIPLIGGAFRSSEKSRSKANLLIFITPTIVEDTDYQPTKTDFLHTPIPKPDREEWSKWDSTKPLDWSKPLFSQYRSSNGQESAKQNPTVQDAVYQNPNPQEPVNQNSEAQDPVYQNPNIQEPADQNSDVQTPADQNSDVQTPADQNSDAQTPADQNSDVQAPADQNSDAQTPADQNSAVQAPADQNSDVQTPADQNPAVQEPVNQNL